MGADGGSLTALSMPGPGGCSGTEDIRRVSSEASEVPVSVLAASSAAVMAARSARSFRRIAGWSPARGNSRGRKVRAPQGRVLANGQGG